MGNSFLTLGLQGYKTAVSLLLGLVVLAENTPAQANTLAMVQSVRATSEQVMLFLSAPTRFSQGSLPKDPAYNRPDRCYVDIFPAALGNHVQPQLDLPVGSVQRVRATQFRLDTARIVLDLLSAQTCQVRALTNPARLQISVGPPLVHSGKPAWSSGEPPLPPAGRQAGTPSTPLETIDLREASTELGLLQEPGTQTPSTPSAKNTSPSPNPQIGLHTSLKESLFANNDPSYSGGRGVITREGISGMYLNPTSGTLNQGQLTSQYCVILANRVGTEVQHMAMLSYGVTDWLEIGAHGRLSDVDVPDQNIAAAGPLLRVRVLKEGIWWPELSVGGILREGNENLTQRTIFVAFSKGIRLTDDRFLRTFRFHGGFRQIWQDPNVNVREASIGYAGGELGLPQHLYLVGEVSNRGDAFRHTPFSFGIQLRRPSGFALSFGRIQGGTERSLSFFGGIGIRFR